ncbi:hypothetical protein C8A01DRAFT_16072 [Parachaetomium inaequale]|uniref:Uncharacterized protein n=1 Tax=Parachaetomium inaequale TaxID=2588326 RepID=A0AAN6PFL1_9PEZI|nr:hypothetical protein C8A01DRAFT_16072 [Parachaetomium inaequale]
MNLTPDHFSALNRAVRTILSSTRASETYAQIVDGLPTHDVYKDYYGWYRIDYETNLAPSKEATEIVATYRKVFDLGTISVDEKVPLPFSLTFAVEAVAQSYQKTSTNSTEFPLRLLQMAAIVCHDIAVYLYTEYDGGIRKSPLDFDPQVPVPRPPPGITLPPLPKMPRRPAELFHEFYMDWEHYPAGVADLVGYWAEYQLFGGVVLFDPGISKTKVCYS